MRIGGTRGAGEPGLSLSVSWGLAIQIDLKASVTVLLLLSLVACKQGGELPTFPHAYNLLAMLLSIQV